MSREWTPHRPTSAGKIPGSFLAEKTLLMVYAPVGQSHCMGRKPNPINPANLNGRYQMSSTIRENWLTALSRKTPETVTSEASSGDGTDQ